MSYTCKWCGRRNRYPELTKLQVQLQFANQRINELETQLMTNNYLIKDMEANLIIGLLQAAHYEDKVLAEDRDRMVIRLLKLTGQV